MSELIVYEKRGGKFAVYRKTQEYDPEKKNSKQIGKEYLGMAETKGGEWKRSKKADIDRIYDYGFLKYIYSFLDNPDIQHYFNYFNSLDQELILYIIYFLIATGIDLLLFPDWLKTTPYNKIKINNTEEFANNLGNIGNMIEIVDKRDYFNLNPNDHFFFFNAHNIHSSNSNSFIGDRFEELIRKDSKHIFSIFFSDLFQSKFFFMPIRASDLLHISILHSISLLNITRLSPDNFELSEIFLKQNIKQPFLFYSDDLSLIKKILPLINNRKFEIIDYPPYTIIKNSTISDKKVQEIIFTQKNIQSRIMYFDIRIKSLLEIISDEIIYPASIGIYFCFFLYLLFYHRISEKLRLGNLFQNIDNNIQKLQFELNTTKLIFYENGSKEEFTPKN